MSIPTDLLYAPTHEWVRIDKGEAVIGITHFAQEQLGDITFVELPRLGAHLAAGQEMGSIESVKAASEIYSPVTGEVIAVNDALDSAPEQVNASPFDSGWLMRVRLSADPAGLLSPAQYQELIANAGH